MDSQKVHQTGCVRSVYPGVGATPMAWGGFTSSGGGGKPSLASQNGSKRHFARLSISSIPKHTEKARGQALVELAVILPVLVLFMVSVIPLVVKGVALPWLDERLTLRQLGQDDEQIHRVLLLTHESDLLPPYFDQTRLEESTRNAPMVMSIPILGKLFPGNITRKLTSATLPEHGWWNRELLGNLKEQDRQLSRGLSMVPARILVESKVPDEVKRWTLSGAASGKTSLLEKAGFNLFHLDLDALPETGEAGGKGK